MITIDQAKQLQVGNQLIFNHNSKLRWHTWNIKCADGQQIEITKVGHLGYEDLCGDWIYLACIDPITRQCITNFKGTATSLHFPLSMLTLANQPKLVASLTDCYTGLFDTKANRTLNDAII